MKASVPSKLFDLCNYLFMILLVIIMLFPFIHIAAISLSSAEPVLQGRVSLWPINFNVASYKKVLSDAQVLIAYKNTILYTVVGTTINMILTTMIAYALAKRKMVLRKLFTFMITFTMLFGGGMIPSYLLVKQLHMINTMWAVTIPGAISTWNLLIMRQFFLAIPESLEESAMIDGYNDIQIFFKIVLPLSKASLATIGLFYAVSHWNSFFVPFIYLNEKSKFPLQIILRSMVVEGNIQPPDQSSIMDNNQFTVVQNIKYTVLMVATIPILLVYPFIQKYFVQGVMIGSIKG